MTACYTRTCSLRRGLGGGSLWADPGLREYVLLVPQPSATALSQSRVSTSATPVVDHRTSEFLGWPDLPERIFSETLSRTYSIAEPSTFQKPIQTSQPLVVLYRHRPCTMTRARTSNYTNIQAMLISSIAARPGGDEARIEIKVDFRACAKVVGSRRAV